MTRMRFSVPDDPIIAVAKVLPKGAVQLPPEVRERLGLKPGTKLILVTAEDAVLWAKKPSRGIMNRLRSIFSQIPIWDADSCVG